MNVLAIGDVVAPVGAEFLKSQLPKIKKEYNIDLVIANGENSAEGNGITPYSANFLFDSGVDVITTGNHAFKRREIYEYFDEHESIIRPLNFPESTTPGRGYCEIDFLKYKKIWCCKPSTRIVSKNRPLNEFLNCRSCNLSSL